MQASQLTSDRGLDSVAVLIPAWQPESAMVSVVEGLAAYGFGLLLLVDDGSSEASGLQFDALQPLPNVKILRHAVNLGKGRALKTGINHILAEMPHITGLVTADADGQHTVADIVRIAEALSLADARCVLGTRSFGEGVPLRSRFGNALTRRIFGLMTGATIGDTQTGLRGFPRRLLPELLVLPGERYEYEMTVLAHLCRRGRRPLEVPIATVYIDDNRASHFNPIWDSMRIYFVLLRFYFSSILASLLDFAIFSATFAISHHLLASVVLGRLSSLVNFALNRRFVFRNRDSVPGTLGRYYVLVAVVAVLSYVLTWATVSYLHWNVFVTKVAVDVLLSLVSFSVQQTFVFRRSEAE